jgi:Ca2+/H+ antiporter
MTRSVLLFLLVISFAIPSAARVYEYRLNCDLGKGIAQNIRVGHSNIVFTPENHLCHIEVVGRGKKTVF